MVSDATVQISAVVHQEAPFTCFMSSSTHTTRLPGTKSSEIASSLNFDLGEKLLDLLWVACFQVVVGEVFNKTLADG